MALLQLRRVRAWTVALLALVGLNGCATSGAPGNRYEVSGPTNQFYKYGPAQAFGPDLNLTKGQKVTMINRQFGFSQIRLEDGQTGYIATEDLKPLPPEPKAPVIASRASRNRSPRVSPPPERGLDLSDVPVPALPE